jgi:hypothetical protein
MKNVFTALLLTFVSSQALATQSDYKFVALDETTATDLCVSAATVGYFETKKIARRAAWFNEVEFITTKCNGLSIRQFAKKYTEMANTEVTEEATQTVSYKFKTVDNSEESQICAVAAKDGMKQAINLGGLSAKLITCNGMRIESFARRFSNS